MPSASATPRRADLRRVRAEAPSPITGLAGLLSTSSTGAKSQSNPVARSSKARSRPTFRAVSASARCPMAASAAARYTARRAAGPPDRPPGPPPPRTDGRRVTSAAEPAARSPPRFPRCARRGWRRGLRHPPGLRRHRRPPGPGTPRGKSAHTPDGDRSPESTECIRGTPPLARLMGRSIRACPRRNKSLHGGPPAWNLPDRHGRHRPTARLHRQLLPRASSLWRSPRSGSGPSPTCGTHQRLRRRARPGSRRSPARATRSIRRWWWSSSSCRSSCTPSGASSGSPRSDRNNVRYGNYDNLKYLLQRLRRRRSMGFIHAPSGSPGRSLKFVEGRARAVRRDLARDGAPHADAGGLHPGNPGGELPPRPTASRPSPWDRAWWRAPGRSGAWSGWCIWTFGTPPGDGLGRRVRPLARRLDL